MARTEPARTKTAADICQGFKLTDPAKDLLRDGIAPRPFLDVLIEKEHFADATRLAAHAMPRREGVWWGIRCARQAYGEKTPEKEEAALQTVERWIVDPSDENRREAFKAAGFAGHNTLAGQLADAVFFSSGSLAPAEAPPVLPNDNLCPNTIANVVILSVIKIGPAKMKDTFRRFLALGLDVAAGKDRWKDKPGERGV